MDREEPLVVSKLKQAKASAEEINLLPETLDQCNVPEPDFEDGLTQDEKFLAISRLEVNGRTRSSEGEKTHMIVPTKGGARLQLRYGWVCQAGFYPEDLNKKNQDNLLVAPDLGSRYPDLSIFGVFDGHGKHGTECSTFAVERFSKCMLAHKQLKTNPETAIIDSLKRTNKDMHKAKKKRKGAGFFDDTLAGTTAINVLFQGNEILVANVGDSRAIMATSTPDGFLKAQALSADQTPYRSDERKRCKEAGAVVMTMDQLEGYRPYDPEVDEWGNEEDDGGDPPRLWLPNKGCPGVAFTRSLGDEMAESIGCVPNPEILRRTVSSQDKFMVIASDGVFEFLSSQTVVDMVAKFTDPYEAARALVTESYKLWLHYEVRTDDITCIVIFLEYPDGDSEPVVSSMGQASATEKGGSLVYTDDIMRLGEQNRPVRREMSRRKRQLIEASAIEDEDEQDDRAAYQSVRALPKLKSPDEIRDIRSAISANFLFNHLNPMQLETVLNAFQVIDVKAGQRVIQQGDVGDLFYVVSAGEYDCFIKDGDGEEKKVHTYVSREGGLGNPSFGELALMYQKPRAASVVAKTDGKLWALGRRTFRRVLIKRPNKELIAALRKVKILESLGASQIQRLADSVSEVSFKDSDVIIQQGDIGETLYIIKDGAVRVTIDETMQEATNKMKRAGTLRAFNMDELKSFEPHSAKEVMRIDQPGGFFGERALLHSEPRAASVISVGPTTCFYVSRKTFEEVLGPLAEIIDKFAKKRQAESLAVVKMQENLRESKLGHIIVEDIISKYAVNSTNTCILRVVCPRDNHSSTFSLKSFDRNAVETSKAKNRVLRDRELLPLAAVNNPEADMGCTLEFVFPILKTLVGEKSLHMALGGIVCGSLNDFLGKPLSEDVARFVAANVLLMLNSMHHRCIMLRSVYPQTLVLDDNGYVRIADMGASKYLEDDSARAYTLVGDTAYLAPEQVLNKGHGFAVDYWALGILLYEMTQGKLPFSSDDPFSEVVEFNAAAVEWPTPVSDNCKALFAKLACPDPAKRTKGLGTLQVDPFFKGFDWNGLQTGRLTSPLKEAAQVAIKEMVEAPTPREDSLDSGSFQSTIPDDAWYKDF